MIFKKKSSIKQLLLQGIYGHRINQGMWLSLATLTLLLTFYLTGRMQYALIPVPAMFNHCQEEAAGKGTEMDENGLKAIHSIFKQLRAKGSTSVHYGIAHLFELIFERLNSIFEILEFCSSESS